MGRAVCRKCWTWHGSGATVCPRCGASLASGSEPAPNPAIPSDTPNAGQPIQRLVPPSTRSVATRPAPSSVRRWWLIAIAGALILILSAVLLVLQGSSRATSTDGTFSVQLPSGWERLSGTSLPDGTATTSDLMVLVGPSADGIQPHLVIYMSPADISALSQNYDGTWLGGRATCQFFGTVGHFSRPAPTTVGGSAALFSDCHTPRVGVEYVVVSHAKHTYTLGFSAASSQFDQLRGGSLQTLLASWRWN